MKPRFRQDGSRWFANGELTRLINQYLGDFCYQTFPEILSMLSLVEEDIDAKSLEMRLYMMWRAGKIDKRPYQRDRLNGYQMKLKEAPQSRRSCRRASDRSPMAHCSASG